MLEKFLAAEVLEIRVLHSAIAQSVVGKVVVCLRIASPAISRVGNGGWPGLSVYTAPNLSSRKRQSIACPSFTNACFMSMIWSSRERNSSCSLVSRRSRGRIANPRSIGSSEKNHGLRFEGILKIDLQGNRPPKAKNRQIRLLERAQSSSPFNSFRILHGRLQHGVGTADMGQDRQPAETRDDLAQEFESLSGSVGLLERQAGQVAARTRQTRDYTGADRVSQPNKHDRDG